MRLWIPVETDMRGQLCVVGFEGTVRQAEQRCLMDAAHDVRYILQALPLPV